MTDVTKNAHEAISILNHYGLEDQADIIHQYYFLKTQSLFKNWPDALLNKLNYHNIDPKELSDIYNPEAIKIDNIKMIRHEWGLMLRESKDIVDLYHDFLNR